jgi:hypothetical protein
VVKKCGRLAILCPKKFGKKFFKKGSPNLGINTLFRSCKPVDVIILSQENRGHPLPRNLGGLAQGIIYGVGHLH